MKPETNTYFQSLQQADAAYQEARAARKATAKYPFANRGQRDAYDAWGYSTKKGSNIFEVRNLPWEWNFHDFVEALRAAGVTEFAVTESNSELIENLHRLAGEGCTVLGLCKVTHSLPQYCDKKIVELDAILFGT